jgi:integrase
LTTKAGSGHVERIGNVWYLRRRETLVDQVSGVRSQRQHRVTLGSARTIRSKAAARKIADEHLARLAAPTLAPGVATTFREYSERFSRDHVQRLREGSRRRYLSCIKLLQSELGDEQLALIDAPRLQTAVTALAKERAPATVKTLRAVALQILRQARRDKFGAHAIDTRDIKLPRPSHPAAERQSWTREQLERIIAADYPPWSTLWGVLGYGGLRAGEAFALTWADIDFDVQTLRIRGNATREGITLPKTAGSTATIPLLPRVAELLTGYRSTWRPNAAGLVFAGRTGSPLIADDVRARKLKPLLARLGLPIAGLHSFRHSAPAILAGMGLTFEAVQRYMRHATAAQTSRYMHFSGEQLRDAVFAAIARQRAQQTPTEGTSP